MRPSEFPTPGRCLAAAILIAVAAVSWGTNRSLFAPLPALFADAEGANDDAGEGQNEGNDGAAETELSGARFRLGQVVGGVGSAVRVPFDLEATEALSMFAFSLLFDPTIFEFVDVVPSTGLQKLLDRVGSESVFEYHVDPDAGWLQVNVVADFEGRGAFAIPPGLLNSAEIEFHVREGVALDTYELRFAVDGEAEFVGHFAYNDMAVYNAARRSGTPFAPEDQFADPELLELEVEDGFIRVDIIGEIGVFRLGDANSDGTVDISDPIRILEFLFQEGGDLACERSADVNLDALVDISDPIFLLDSLFTDTSDRQLVALSSSDVVTDCDL